MEEMLPIVSSQRNRHSKGAASALNMRFISWPQLFLSKMTIKTSISAAATARLVSLAFCPVYTAC